MSVSNELFIADTITLNMSEAALRCDRLAESLDLPSTQGLRQHALTASALLNEAIASDDLQGQVERLRRAAGALERLAGSGQARTGERRSAIAALRHVVMAEGMSHALFVLEG